MKKKKLPTTPDTFTSPLQTQALQTSDTERTAANQSLDTAKDAYSQFLPGSAGASQYRKNLYAGLSGSTARTNDNQMAHARERAQAAGFGGGQPIAVAAGNEVANEGANRIAQIPLQVEQAAMPYEMQAIQGTTGIGNTQLANSQQMFGQATGMEDQRLQEFYKQQEEARKRKSGIWGALAKVGLGIAGNVFPGVFSPKKESDSN